MYTATPSVCILSTMHYIPYSLAYKILVMVRASDFRGILDWSYSEGGLICKINLYFPSPLNFMAQYGAHHLFPAHSCMLDPFHLILDITIIIITLIGCQKCLKRAENQV